MKLIKLLFVSVLLLFVSNAVIAQNYSIENEGQEPLYLDFIFAPKKIKEAVKVEKKRIKSAPKRTNYIKNELVLLYANDDVDNISDLLQQYQLDQKSKNSLPSIRTTMVVANTNGQNPLTLSQKINKQEKNILAITNNLFNTASTSFKNAYSMYETGVSYVHKTTQGEGTTVCMVDTPIDIYHPSLSKAHIETLDLVKFNPENSNSMLHGTAVAGILVSQNTHIGIAPKTKLYSVGAFQTSNGTERLHGSSSNIAKAIDTCIQHKVDVMNLSFTGSRDSLLEKMVTKAIDKRIIVVAAAGNGGNWGSTIYPALIPGVITATAVDEKKHLFSKADKGLFIDYSAPGVNVLTIAPGGKYKLATGTSISSAHVSGIIALLLSQRRTNNIDVTLAKTVEDLGKPGRDQMYGEGLISASNALDIIKASKSKTH
ncbi:MAG: S8 family serine peptidase [Cocleimonas sp.]